MGHRRRLGWTGAQGLGQLGGQHESHRAVGADPTLLQGAGLALHPGCNTERGQGQSNQDFEQQEAGCRLHAHWLCPSGRTEARPCMETHTSRIKGRGPVPDKVIACPTARACPLVW